MNRRNFLACLASLLPLKAIAKTKSSQQVFANIGDYGNHRAWGHSAVANLVNSWNPDAVTTNGDNSYTYNYLRDNRKYLSHINKKTFLPCIGNHDRDSGARGGKLYTKFFGVKDYYYRDFDNIRFIMIDSTRLDIRQISWIKNSLENSTKKWNVAIFHYPPYSSGDHGSFTPGRLPFKEWGADLVIAGHDHHYERNGVDGVNYVVNGLGGKSIYPIRHQSGGGKVIFNDTYGAMKICVTGSTLVAQFISINGSVIDEFKLGSVNISAALMILLADDITEPESIVD